jgi:hypothetical protein
VVEKSFWARRRAVSTSVAFYDDWPVPGMRAHVRTIGQAAQPRGQDATRAPRDIALPPPHSHHHPEEHAP